MHLGNLRFRLLAYVVIFFAPIAFLMGGAMSLGVDMSGEMEGFKDQSIAIAYHVKVVYDACLHLAMVIFHHSVAIGAIVFGNPKVVLIILLTAAAIVVIINTERRCRAVNTEFEEKKEREQAQITSQATNTPTTEQQDEESKEEEATDSETSAKTVTKTIAIPERIAPEPQKVCPFIGLMLITLASVSSISGLTILAAVMNI